MFRPVELQDMCLYDWVWRCSHKKIPVSKGKVRDVCVADIIVHDDEQCISDTDSDFGSGDHHVVDTGGDDTTVAEKQGATKTNLLHFTNSHPLHAPHGIHCVTEERALVPNFSGETLPRQDQGNHEWYCATMMTLFKPWRVGTDLKIDNETWDNTFTSYEFTLRQLDVINNFNLRYECLDARDDFHAQMKNNAGLPPSWAQFGNEIDGHGDLPSFNNSDGGEDISGVQEGEQDFDMSQVGRSELKHCCDMTIMKEVMQQAGWVDPLSATVLDKLTPLEIVKSGQQWKADVKRKRQDIIDQRANKPGNLSEDPCDSSNQASTLAPQQDNAYGDVRIVDKSYLEQKLHSIRHKPVIDDIIRKFELNCEQERAFRIVANHACQPNPEQLKMYIGGM